MVVLKSVNQLKSKPISFFPSGIRELDWQLGKGFAEGKLSIWAGEKGIGKSRTAISIAKKLNERYPVLVVSGELPAEQFKEEKLKGYSSDNFYIINTKKLSEVCEAIVQSKAKIVFIDSINMIKEYNKGRGAELVVDGGEYKGVHYKGLRKIAEEVGCHIALIAQLTVSGTTKGGTDLPHLVDVEVYIKRWGGILRTLFQIEVEKNRMGESDRTTYWRHAEDGVHLESSDRTKRIEDNNRLNSREKVKSSKPSLLKRIWG